MLSLLYFYYSVLKLLTGSCLLAIFAGISPAIIVNTTLIKTSIAPPITGRWLKLLTSATFCIIKFIGILSKIVTPIPITPANSQLLKFLH